MARNTQQSQMARSIHSAPGASTVAGLEGRTTAEAAQAPRNAGLNTGTRTNFSGQWLYDRFVGNDKTEITKLSLVRQMAESMEIDAFKKSIGDMVAIATNMRDKAIDAAKEAGTYNKDKPTGDVAATIARLKTAQNHQTVLRVAYGAIRFAGDHLAEQGYNDSTGYMVMAVIARKALNAAGIKWDGTKQLTATQTEKRAQSAAEEKALSQVMKDTPRDDGESMGKYLARVEKQVDAQVAKDRAEAEQKRVTDLVRKVREQCGGLLDDVLERLLAGEPAPRVVDDAPALEPKAAAAASKDAVKH